MKNKTIMIQSTNSDAGKSLIVTGLCRLFARNGIRVVPFKPQNMALNSAVTIDSGEIGRAQAIQAQAAFLEPHTDMNPVLLKPNTDIGAQVIIHGRAVANMDARIYHEYKTVAMQAVIESYKRLLKQYDLIIVEGAGSPAEINLRDKDIANMGFAEAVNCPVCLVGDIDRGGVFAHLYGTISLLRANEQQRIAGLIINQFRGDINLLSLGLNWLEHTTGKPVWGILPYLDHLYLDAEDNLTLHKKIITEQKFSDKEILTILVITLPRMSNHNDFDPLRIQQGTNLIWAKPGLPLPYADLIIIPGSKNTRSDLEFLRKQGWEGDLKRHLRYGGKLIGICGGFQMLGQQIHDPHGLEGNPGSSVGLRLMEFETTLHPQKQLSRVSGQLMLLTIPPISGYEIHSGISYGIALSTPAITLADGRTDGALSQDGQLLGTYIHGLFDSTLARHNILQWVYPSLLLKSTDYFELRENSINKIADAISANINLNILRSLCL